MSIKDHGGQFGGGLSKGMNIPLLKLNLRRPVTIFSLNLNSSYSQHLVAKYVRSDGKLSVIPVYTGGVSVYVYNLETGVLQSSFTYNYASYSQIKAIFEDGTSVMCIGINGMSIHNLTTGASVTYTTSVKMNGGRAIRNGELVVFGSGGQIYEVKVSDGSLVRSVNLNTGVSNTTMPYPMCADGQGNYYGLDGQLNLVKFKMDGTKLYTVKPDVDLSTSQQPLTSHQMVYSKKRGTILILQIRVASRDGSSVYVPFVHEVDPSTGITIQIHDLYVLFDKVKSDNNYKGTINTTGDTIVVSLTGYFLAIKEDDFTKYAVDISPITIEHDSTFTTNGSFAVGTSTDQSKAQVYQFGVTLK